MSRAKQQSRRYNEELAELLKARKPYSNLELAEICVRLGDTLEAERWREAEIQDCKV